MQVDQHIIRFAAIHPQAWKNGAGTTREIAREGECDAWQWRISIADVVAEAPFSSFPGVDRILVLLEGEGIALTFEDGQRMDVLPPFGSARFAGEAALVGTPVSGATRDFNLMWQRSQVSASLEVRPLVGSMVVFKAAEETWMVHVLEGTMRLPDSEEDLSRGDTLTLRGNARTKVRLEGAGTALLIRLRPLDESAS
ncbi:HutD family protein [Lysobacter sp. HDW10]|uniref:HutD/Ves family protein n=1 Tax=Lysobacter sp. HDW10 TaxID=2714936 RepID=UPI00140BDE3D|nr:HutD family protein [Lysobacter sp. HDW10]QIK80270.1 HutD family protein [Lysobacter sp. HDW10]